MTIAKQMSWVFVRVIGLGLVIYSCGPLIAVVGNSYLAYTLREHNVIVVESDGQIPEQQQNTPLNREMQRNCERAKMSAKLNAVFFLLSVSVGMYCLKGGQALQKLLMPPAETEMEITYRDRDAPCGAPLPHH